MIVHVIWWYVKVGHENLCSKYSLDNLKEYKEYLERKVSEVEVILNVITVAVKQLG